MRNNAGFSKTTEYRTWRLIKYRCLNPRCKAYKNYGGRGIAICEDWLAEKDGFKNFLKCVGKKPNSSLTIDRINNDGNYEPGNVRWATRKEQRHNRRATKKYKTKGLRKYKNKNGFSGVTKIFNSFRAAVWNGSKMIHVGCFPTAKQAYEAFLKAKLTNHRHD